MRKMKLQMFTIIECEGESYLLVTKNVARPESRSILSMGTIAKSSVIYLTKMLRISVVML